MWVHPRNFILKPDYGVHQREGGGFVSDGPDDSLCASSILAKEESQNSTKRLGPDEDPILHVTGGVKAPVITLEIGGGSWLVH